MLGRCPNNSMVREWKPMDKLSVYVFWKTRNFEFSHSSLQNGNLDLFMVYRMEPWNFYSLRSTERETEIFPVYGMETQIFPVYGLKPGKFSGLRKRNQNFSGIPDQGFGKQDKFRFQSHPEISRNSTLRNKFPKCNFFPK